MSIILSKSISYNSSTIDIQTTLNTGTNVQGAAPLQVTTWTHSITSRIDGHLFTEASGLSDADLLANAQRIELEAKRKVDISLPDRQPVVAQLEDLGFSLP